jgi:diguanylate cyclase (GGDEF)-like protein/PAS domain S-box-containing protein
MSVSGHLTLSSAPIGFDSAPDAEATLECTLDGAVMTASAGALTMFRMRADEIVGRPIDALLTGATSLDDVAAAGVAAPAVRRVHGRRANGVPFPVSAVVSMRGHGAERRLAWSLRELERADFARIAGERFDATFEHAPIGMGLFNCDGEYVRVNPELCRILGRSEADLVGRRDQSLTHPDDRDADLDAAAEILAGRRHTFQTEKRFLRPDGSVVWTIANLTFMRGDDGCPLMWVGQFQDITARRATEAALRRERDLSQTILDSMSDGVLLTRDGEIVAVNDALCRLTGFARGELVGAGPPYPFTPPERREEVLAARDRLVATGGGEMELTVMRKDGERFPAALTSAPAVGYDGRTSGFVTALRDISERKRHEQELTRRATRDGLTGLLNRTAFLDRLAAEVASARGRRRPVTLALIDVDRFKSINDRHGHPVGDGVLAEIADRLRTMSRTGDHVARVGGEEFAWLLPDADLDAAHAAAERTRQAIRASISAGDAAVTVSIGICALTADREADELYRLADVALYRAKRAGRDRCAVHPD